MGYTTKTENMAKKTPLHRPEANCSAQTSSIYNSKIIPPNKETRKKHFLIMQIAN